MSLVYVYAIARAGSTAPKGLRGLDDGEVRTVGDGDLAAFVSDVAERDYAEEPLNAHLADMEWLTPRAVRHQEVNAALAGVCDPLVPLSFGTVFRDTAGVSRMLRERAAEIGPRFEALRGKAEWIAVVRRDRERALAAVETGSEPLVEDAGGGMLARFSVLAGRDAAGSLDGIRAGYAERWDGRGYALELSGPWPAYRFSTVDLS